MVFSVQVRLLVAEPVIRLENGIDTYAEPCIIFNFKFQALYSILRAELACSAQKPRYFFLSP